MKRKRENDFERAKKKTKSTSVFAEYTPTEVVGFQLLLPDNENSAFVKEEIRTARNHYLEKSGKPKIPKEKKEDAPKEPEDLPDEDSPKKDDKCMCKENDDEIICCGCVKKICEQCVDHRKKVCFNPYEGPISRNINLCHDCAEKSRKNKLHQLVCVNCFTVCIMDPMNISNSNLCCEHSCGKILCFGCVKDCSNEYCENNIRGYGTFYGCKDCVSKCKGCKEDFCLYCIQKDGACYDCTDPTKYEDSSSSSSDEE